MTKEKKELASKLILIQQELKVPKNQYNNFGKYKYRNCEDILEAVKPLLKKHNVLLTISDKMHNLGNRYYIEATVTISNDELDVISVSAFAREAENKKGMDEAQITGAASSYARKYALNGLFAIDDTKDSDSTNTHEELAPKTFSNEPYTATITKTVNKTFGETPVGSNKGKKIGEPCYKCKTPLIQGKTGSAYCKPCYIEYMNNK